MTTRPPRPFRFGVGPAGLAMPIEAWPAYARDIEARGFASLVVGDHPSLDRFGPLVAMTAAALATTTLRIGAHTFGNDYRNPLVLARELAGLDRLAGGRLELGIGAGWLEGDYAACGIAFERPGLRLARLAEAITIIEHSFYGPPVEFIGTHYHAHIAMAGPAPVQTHVPLMLGGGGPRMLELAARRADIVGLNFSFRTGSVHEWATETISSAATRAKIDLVRAAAGERIADIELAMTLYGVYLGHDCETAATRLGAGFGLTADQVLDSPHFLLGSRAHVIDQLIERRAQLGLSYYTVSGDMIADAEPLVEAINGT
jgi:probable F420-dependent oxidoreductase